MLHTPVGAVDSQLAPLASRSLLLDLAVAGNRVVAVGDRGHVLLSDDAGKTWRQVVAPSRAMLTGIAFADAARAWAVGHDGTILTSSNAGESWQRTDDGTDLETVWLDVHFSDPSRGFIVGAYGKALMTVDGGRKWSVVQPVDDEVHYNHIGPAAGSGLRISGEAGLVLVSRDEGVTWSREDLPYDGSLFGSVTLPDGGSLVFGMRGHVFAVDADTASSWQDRPTPVPALLLAGTRLRSNVIVLAGQGGNCLISHDAGRSFSLWKPPAYNGGIAALLEAADGTLIVGGELGVARLQLPPR